MASDSGPRNGVAGAGEASLGGTGGTTAALDGEVPLAGILGTTAALDGEVRLAGVGGTAAASDGEVLESDGGNCGLSGSGAGGGSPREGGGSDGVLGTASNAFSKSNGEQTGIDGGKATCAGAGSTYGLGGGVSRGGPCGTCADRGIWLICSLSFAISRESCFADSSWNDWNRAERLR
jgi:hypothetical protein